MSAYMVSKTQIDMMLTAGLVWGVGPHKLRWFWPEITEEDRRETSSMGVAITEEDVELAKKRSWELTVDTAGRIGAELLAENQRSINFRYAEDDVEIPYEFERLGININPMLVLRAINNYVYQACEHPEWIRSEAKSFTDALKEEAIRNLPGYDSAPWGFNDPNVFGPKVVSIMDMIERNK